MPIEILMPALSPTMTEGNLAKWNKNEGDKVSPGDVSAEIETDKATMEVEAVDEGVIGKIIVASGTQAVKVNECIAVLLEEGEDKASLKDFVPSSVANEVVAEESSDEQASDAAAPAEKTAAPAVAAGAGFTPPPTVTLPDNALIKLNDPTMIGDTARVTASPLARRMAEEAGIPLQNIKGTGPRGRIVRHDVQEAIRAGGVVKRVVRQEKLATAVPVDMMRKVIAERLLQSKQHIPHFYLTVECVLDKLMELRADINAQAPLGEDGKPLYKISVNDLVIKASAYALKAIPEANASWDNDQIIMYNNVDISVAVAIEGGLITPIVKNADQKTIIMISNEMKSLAKRARQGALAPEEYQGGGFSISNLGMYGIKQFNAIVNPPQSCILAVGGAEEKVVLKDGQVSTQKVMNVSASCDHRVVDGAVGAEFLQAFKQAIEKPSIMLL
jgi:pyruvate dehydrogenase E2 component (dihydrolipoamide acetyltransferase)